MSEAKILRTPLYDAHVALGARMVPFAGYEMPVQYPSGIIAEHNWTRQHAGLFDVSHMGQCFIVGDAFEATAEAMERLVPADIKSLTPRQQRYSQLLNAEGGIIDDLMITRSDYKGHEGWLYVVVNAGRKHIDYAHIEKNLAQGTSLKRGEAMSLLALQGPEAENVLSHHVPLLRGLPFMHYHAGQIGGINAHISRSGYTGEDGFEISVLDKDVTTLWELLLSDPAVKPIGLGARDSLRLEAGLCLHGHDIDETTDPVEAGLVWSIGKRRRTEGGFIGADKILAAIAHGPSRKRVGIRPDGRAPARDGTVITDSDGRDIGIVTSGGFGPTVNGPVAMGYVETQSSADGTSLQLIVRGRPLPASVVPLPFVAHNFKR